ncbi:uncharacterized protein LOC130497630 [Raphanus sativus]|uniref:Uncharacterized protein LOC130497630 n=1 Tax=Raphanus sativus TaxID=3726 RepID=A0A9W3C4Z4_RAPSA|nr:uncharacterized protein LOC130497630 [Raphanus sativus]
MSLVVDDLINPIDRFWNMDLLNEYFHQDDVKTIRGLEVSRTQRPDMYGWMFTESGKYSVKSEKETVNHILFECPSTLQTWALSRIPSLLGIFRSSSVFTSLDYLFWRLPKENKNGNPHEVLRRAEVEGTLSADAQLLLQKNQGQFQTEINWQYMEDTRICFVDGGWREQDIYTGQGWYCRKMDSEDVMMGTMNLRRSLSPLHAECEALIWAMKCMKNLQFSDVVFATDCSQLVKMVFSPDEWSAFATHM